MYRYRDSSAMLNSRLPVVRHAAAGFTIHYWGVDDRLPTNSVHKHSFFEMCYVLAGNGEYTDDGTDYPLQRGAMFLSRPGVLHQIRTEEGLGILFVAFELDEQVTDAATLAAFRSLADEGRVYLENGSDSPTARLWESILLHEDERLNLPATAVSAAAYALLLSFLTLFGKQERPPQPTRPQDSAVLKRAKLYIRDNLSKPLSLPDIAAYLNISERHLSRLFAAGIHESFTGYVRDERIREAARLLTAGELPIKEIAELTGFSSVHYFTRTFRHVKGMPPGEFRSRAMS